MSNWVAVLFSFLYVFAVLGVAEGLRRALQLPVAFTRKVVHIGVGMWAWGTAALFTDKWFASIPPAVFIVLNYVSYRRNLFTAMESADKSNLGTVFPAGVPGHYSVVLRSQQRIHGGRTHAHDVG